ncbi:hypothetical protein QTO34_006802 [Cnephaeus nilssonii]|uniref:Uncharacterized protein n=1 Tax=Cnephaeus nilssonii TaxID=3371016 RepID=A0AA40HMC2_CNENI|nr:hypothetical protein QTO34_006802 [Eptesicus nilssonii]
MKEEDLGRGSVSHEFTESQGTSSPSDMSTMFQYMLNNTKPGLRGKPVSRVPEGSRSICFSISSALRKKNLFDSEYLIEHTKKGTIRGAGCLSAGAPGLSEASASRKAWCRSRQAPSSPAFDGSRRDVSSLPQRPLLFRSTAMAQTLSSHRRWRCELSVPLAQSATPATPSPAPCASRWPNRGRSGVMTRPGGGILWKSHTQGAKEPHVAREPQFADHGFSVIPIRQDSRFNPRAAILGLNGDLGMPVKAGEEGKDDGFGEAEYAAINSRLDQINSCLDHLVENDNLHTRLQELLESNQQTHLELQPQWETPAPM